MSVRSRINYLKVVIPMEGEGLIIGIMVPKDTVKCYQYYLGEGM